MLTALVSACGGGGGGGGSASPAQTPSSNPPATSDPDTDFSAGIFEPYQNFEQICESPRSGADSRGRPFTDSQGTSTDENYWLRSWSNDLYLWYGEITDVDPASLSPEDYFDEMKTFATTPSGAAKDKFHFTIPTEDWIDQSQSGISGGYGATFAFLSSSPPRQIVVAYTEPDTPATAPETNLQRGDTILEIDGADLISGNDLDTLNAGLFPGDNETHSFVIQQIDGSVRNVTMTSTQITSAPVQNVSMLETETGLVGYMTFNDHIRTAEQQLIAAVEQLDAGNVTDLVLDLRYNGGGFLDIANEISFMIAGPSAATGQVFEALQFNDKHTQFDPVTGNPLEPNTFHTTPQFSSGSPLPSLDLARVFVLTGPGTCSASESIINSLRGIDVEVIQVGTTSCGKPYGFYPFDNCGTTYFSIQFRGVNNKNFGDYSDGFSPENTPQVEGVPVPGCVVSDDFTRQLGDPLEGRLRAALQFRENSTCPSTTNARLKPVRAGWQQLSKADGEIIKPEFLKNSVLRRQKTDGPN
ncbi:MAG: peptidase [Gammaproteobacteria bacterium]|nr:peptidase [Gammaproteobacteria bacterium]MBT4494869.1 peptidase [Gammaproteobacteria bacterium]